MGAEHDLFKSEYNISKRRRLVNWWFGFDALNWPSHDQIEKIKHRAERLAGADATGVILFGAHFRWDFLPYFTMLHDYIGTVAEELHKYGIEVFDRHSVNLVHRYDTREEMRHVMLHSGPHLPLSPSREAAKTWEYNGKRLNDWRMVDVRTREVLYFPQYAAEGFCYRNPDFVDAYVDYAKRLISDTGIDGLAAEDSVHYMHFSSCACRYCRAAFRDRTGIELPPSDDSSFFGNWDNPMWNAWIDLRYDMGRSFHKRLREELPEGFPILTCGGNSASYNAAEKACDARVFSEGGSNYVHSELCGNTPPYKQDKVTVNEDVADKIAGLSHHQAVAEEFGIRSFSTGYGFTEPSANIIWAVNKMLDADCLFSTLKARLGLPEHILDTLPEEADVIGRAFRFEKEHPELFSAKPISQVGVYFSDETRDHTMFGNIKDGYYADYSSTVLLLLSRGIGVSTLLRIPTDVEKYPVIILSSVASMTEDEISAIRKYVGAGGKVIVCGPSPLPECKNSWALPTRPEIASPAEFFDGIANGVWIKLADWMINTSPTPPSDKNEWREVSDGIYYNPHRVNESGVADTVAELSERFAKKLPVKVISAKGYIASVFGENGTTVIHLLAKDYDTDIDHELDEIRFHRSRVNYINKVEPIGISESVKIEAPTAPIVYTPFNDGVATVSRGEDGYTVTLPEKTAYAILYFPG